MKKCLLLLLFFIPCLLIGQNVVENGSFETITNNGCSLNNGTYFGAFSNPCLGVGWRCYSPIPVVATNAAPGDGVAADSSHFAKMHATDNPFDRSAIYYTGLEVCQGMTYDIRFSVRAGIGFTGFNVVAIDFAPGSCAPQAYFIDPTEDEVAKVLSQGTIHPVQGWVDIELNDVTFDFPPGIPAGNAALTELIIYPTFIADANVKNPTRHLYFDQLEIEATTICDGILDTQACPEQGDFGTLIVGCGLGEYDWDFGPGASGIVTTGPNSSRIDNATPGTYSLKYTNLLGCSIVRTYVVDEFCPCNPPGFVGCVLNTQTNQAFVDWDDVPGAAFSDIEIIPNSPLCDCHNPMLPTPSAQTFTGLVNSVFEVSNIPNLCFAFRIRSVCDDGVESDWTNLTCFDDFEQCVVLKNTTAPFGQVQAFDAQTNTEKTRAQVYPNPNDGALIIDLNFVQSTHLTLELFSVDGRLVDAQTNLSLPDGRYQQTWQLAPHLENGIYLLRMTTANETIQQKIILSR
ncbi:MAG: T9SS type A sorting domain-containing protein [Bacteroidota bacterium]